MKAKKLSTAEAYYAEQHAGSSSAEEIAKELGLTPAAVRAHLKKAAAKAPPKEAAFAVQGGQDGRPLSVAMTPSQAQTDDEARQAKPFNKEFFKSLKGGIHVMDPSKPVL